MSWIIRNRKLALPCRINIGDVIESPGWNTVEEFLSSITMRVDKAQSSAREDILHHQITQERGLPRVGFDNH